MLEQLRVMDEENERKAREDEEAREEYRERKEREKAEKEEKEEEERRLIREEEEERKNVEEREQEAEEGDKEVDEEAKGEQTQEQGELSSSSEGGPVAKPASAPRPAPPQPHSDDLSGGMKALQLSSAAATANAAPNAGGAKINFSEFEAESDPFDSMELKTINELQELAAVLQKTTTAAGHESSVVQSVSTATAGAPPNFQQHQFHQQPYPPAQQV